LGIGGAGGEHPNYRIDTATGETLQPLRLPEEIDRMLTAAGALWTADNESGMRDRGQRASNGKGEVRLSDRLRELGERFAIYGDRLVGYAKVNANYPETRIVGIELQSGAKSWEMAASEEPPVKLANVLFCDEEIVVLRQRLAGGSGGRGGCDLVSVQPRTGEQRVLATLPSNAEIAGAGGFDTSVRWRLPVVVALTPGDSAASSTRIDCVDLKSRRTWMRSILMRLNIEWPTAPAVGQDVIGIAYTTFRPGSNQPQHEIRFFRRDNGEYAVESAFALDGRPRALATTNSSFFALTGSTMQDVKVRRFYSLPETAK
jgi:hypothetical protein